MLSHNIRHNEHGALPWVDGRRGKGEELKWRLGPVMVPLLLA